MYAVQFSDSDSDSDSAQSPLEDINVQEKAGKQQLVVVWVLKQLPQVYM